MHPPLPRSSGCPELTLLGYPCGIKFKSPTRVCLARRVALVSGGRGLDAEEEFEARSPRPCHAMHLLALSFGVRMPWASLLPRVRTAHDTLAVKKSRERRHPNLDALTATVGVKVRDNMKVESGLAEM